MRDLAPTLLRLTFALLAHFCLVFDEAIPSAYGCIMSADAFQLLAFFSHLLQRQKLTKGISSLPYHFEEQIVLLAIAPRAILPQR